MLDGGDEASEWVDVDGGCAVVDGFQSGGSKLWVEGGFGLWVSWERWAGVVLVDLVGERGERGKGEWGSKRMRVLAGGRW